MDVVNVSHFPEAMARPGHLTWQGLSGQLPSVSSSSETRRWSPGGRIDWKQRRRPETSGGTYLALSRCKWLSSHLQKKKMVWGVEAVIRTWRPTCREDVASFTGDDSSERCCSSDFCWLFCCSNCRLWVTKWRGPPSWNIVKAPYNTVQSYADMAPQGTPRAILWQSNP